MEGFQERILAVVLLDVLIDACALLFRVKLGSPCHHQRLVRTGRLAVVDGRDRAHHGRVGGQRAGRAETVATVDGLEGRCKRIAARHGALHQRRQLVRVRAQSASAVEGRVGVGLRLGLGLRDHGVPPRHLRQHVLAGGVVGDDGLHQRGVGGRDDRLTVVGHDLGLLAGHGFVVEVGHQHGGSLHLLVHDVAVLDLLERGGGLKGRGLGGASVGGLVGAALLLAGQGRAAIFGVDGAVVAEEEVATYKGAAALEALEGSLFGVWWVRGS